MIPYQRKKLLRNMFQGNWDEEIEVKCHWWANHFHFENIEQKAFQGTNMRYFRFGKGHDVERVLLFRLGLAFKQS